MPRTHTLAPLKRVAPPLEPARKVIPHLPPDREAAEAALWVLRNTMTRPALALHKPR